MLHRLWQSTMIALARPAWLRTRVQSWRATSALATRFVAGRTAEEGVGRARAMLEREGLRASLYYLGEYVDTAERVAENVAAKHAVASLLAGAGLDVHVSVDPTQIGQCVDAENVEGRARAIAGEIAAAAAGRAGVNLMMIDMEDERVVATTIALHDALKAACLPVALTLQAYLRRTEADLAAQVRAGAAVRLVKGAFVAGRDIAFTGKAEIKASYRRLVELMFSPAARTRGFYPIVATHDDRLQEHAIRCAGENGWSADDYEFEMLLGVREALARQRVAEGFRVRLYTPFGRDWWPYAIRRIGESPGNALLLARSVLG
jgi:proline dehydrogenase